LINLVPDAATKTLLEKELKDVNLPELEKTIVERATVAVDKASEALRRAVSDALNKALPGKLKLTGTLSEFAIENFSLSEKAITTQVALRGPLSVEYTP
jgi:hypothetical protein